MIAEAVLSQYLAALEMMRCAVTKCPEELWADPADNNSFWLVAYHAVFYTHLYVYPIEADFVPWEKGRPEVQVMGKTPAEPTPYTKAGILAYVDHTVQVIKDVVPKLEWTAESGFDWLPLDKLTVQSYNIRHLQQRTGELYERLNARAGVDLDWVGQVAAT